MWSSWCFSTSMYWFIQDRSVCVAVYLLACHHVSLEYETLAISSRQNGEYVSLHQQTFNCGFLFLLSKFKLETDWNLDKTLEIHAFNCSSCSVFTVEPAVDYQTKLIDSFVAFAAFFDQWYLTSLRRSRNEKITEIRAGSLSLCLLTRLLPAGSPSFWIHSLPLARVLPNVSLLAG